MQVTIQLDVNTSAKATLRDGKLNVELFCAVGYGSQGRSVTISRPLTDDAKLQPIYEALVEALKVESPSLLLRARAAADEAYRIAVNKGEE